MITKIPVYDVFSEGAKKGLQTAVKIMPTMIGLMVGVGVLRASGLLEMEWKKQGQSWLLLLSYECFLTVLPQGYCWTYFRAAAQIRM